MAAPSFLAERLAKASAVPAEQRSADVRAFIETCRLQAELVEELGLPEVIDDDAVIKGLQSRWSAAPALKLLRSHLVSPSGSLLRHLFQLHQFATAVVYMSTSSGASGTLPSDLGRELMELLERDPSLETLAILAAGLPGVEKDRGAPLFQASRADPLCSARGCNIMVFCYLRAGKLKMFNSAVALMQRPAVRRRLQSELAALPHKLVSYEELLAFFINLWSHEALDLMAGGGTEALYQDADFGAAIRHAVELLPQLAPDNPRFRYTAVLMAKCVSAVSHAPAATRTRYRTLLSVALDVARQQGNDYYTALCGYHMASAIKDWVAEAAVRQGLPPPSAVLVWLLQAEAAHRRCKALLPKQWTSDLDDMKAVAAPAKASLEQLQQQGDRWRRLTPAEQQGLEAAVRGYLDDYNDPNSDKKKLMCSGCGKCAPQLRMCGACREAKYCR